MWDLVSRGSGIQITNYAREEKVEAIFRILDGVLCTVDERNMIATIMTPVGLFYLSATRSRSVSFAQPDLRCHPAKPVETSAPLTTFRVLPNPDWPKLDTRGQTTGRLYCRTSAESRLHSTG